MWNITQIEKNRVGMDADNGIFAYTYDPLGQLVAAVHGDAVKRYRYDELGNRVREWKGEKYDPVNWTEHKYNARNQLIQTQEGDLLKSYRYDRRGNLTNITQNGQLQSRYTYDPRGMMTEAFTTGKGRATYTYDGFLGRVNKLEYLQQAGQALPTDPTSELRYLRDFTRPYDNLLMTSGAQNQSFVWGNSLISAQGEEAFFYLQDHLGSPIRLLGADCVDAPLAYDEFGVPLAGVMGNGGNPFGFTGYQMDSVSGLFYAQARYYQPSMGRFAAEDIHWHPENMIYGDSITRTPMGSLIPNHDAILQRKNLYGYCRSNPIILVDHLGLCDCDATAHDLFYDFVTSGNIWGFIVAGDDILFSLYFSELRKAIQNGARPNNIGPGLWNKKVNKELAKLAKTSKTSSKIFKGLPYVGIAFDVGEGLYDNVQAGASSQKIVVDATVDIALTGGSIWASAAIGAGIGTIVPGVGNIVGGVVGFGVGMLLYWGTDVATVDGKTIRSHVKDGANEIANDGWARK